MPSIYIFKIYHGGLFVWLKVFRPIEEFFNHNKTSPLSVKRYKFWPIIDTHDHWAVSVLACHTYCDMRYPFIIVIYEDPWHSYLVPSVWQWSCHYLFIRLSSVTAEIRTLACITFKWRDDFKRKNNAYNTMYDQYGYFWWYLFAEKTVKYWRCYCRWMRSSLMLKSISKKLDRA